jgi:zinc transport system substrate-binding protein
MDATKHATNRTIVVGHDAYKHLAARYGLKTVALAGLHASEPTPKAIEEAIKTIKAQKAKIIFAEPQLNRTAAERIAKATGAEIRTLDPLGDGDYFKMMNDNLEALKAALGDDRAEPAKTKP